MVCAACNYRFEPDSMELGDALDVICHDYTCPRCGSDEPNDYQHPLLDNSLRLMRDYFMVEQPKEKAMDKEMKADLESALKELSATAELTAEALQEIRFRQDHQDNEAAEMRKRIVGLEECFSRLLRKLERRFNGDEESQGFLILNELLNKGREEPCSKTA